jgi:adenylosuccinate synthase
MSYRLAVLGGQWGDEGKGKVVDWLGEHFKIVVRFNGGANAGHTVSFGGKTHFFHLMPSGMVRPDRTCVIANGVVIHPPTLFEEIDRIEAAGLSVKERLLISDRAHLVFPYHRAMDRLREESAVVQKIGTTQRGIGPAYEDKAGRRGVRAGVLRDLDALREQVFENVEQANRLFSLAGFELFEAQAVYDEYAGHAERMRPFIADTQKFLNDTNEPTLFEGAQGTLLDLDHGTYPYVTSSSASIGGVGTGTGVSPRKIDAVVGVFKAYSTRVGEGPFPSELKDETGDTIRRLGKEYGTTTGRPRRCGWLDAVAGAYTVRVNGFTQVALMLLDVLDEFEEIGICTAYKYKGTTLKDLPSDVRVLAACEPVFKKVKGWRTKTRGANRFDALPQAARDYVRHIEDAFGCPVGLISTGPERESTVARETLNLPGSV